MKLILMTRPDFFVEESQIITALFDEGLELLHVRKPDSEPVYSERLLSLIPENYHKNIVVHDHFYLKGEILSFPTTTKDTFPVVVRVQTNSEREFVRLTMSFCHPSSMQRARTASVRISMRAC